jgi:DNA polymerase III delta prime subunit
LRVPAPDDLDISNILSNISSKENFNLEKMKIDRIVKDCKGNVRRAILCLQHSYMTLNSNEPYYENWKHSISNNIVGKWLALSNCLR